MAELTKEEKRTLRIAYNHCADPILKAHIYGLLDTIASRDATIEARDKALEVEREYKQYLVSAIQYWYDYGYDRGGAEQVLKAALTQKEGDDADHKV